MKINILVIGLLASLSASARELTPPAIVDGLHLVPDTQLGLVYAEPDADLSVYRQLLLIDAQVAFKKNWQREINQDKPYHVTAGDMQKIREEVSALFREIFTRELRDSITGDVLVKAMDFQFDRSNITPFMMDRTRNERAARQFLTNWAQVLVNGLKETGVSTSARP